MQSISAASRISHVFFAGTAEACWKHDWLFQGLSGTSGFTGTTASPFEASFDDPLEGLKQQRSHGRNGNYGDVAMVKMVVDANDIQ